MRSSEEYNKKVMELVKRLDEADGILVGGASGMSAAAGFRHYYERDREFVEHFGDFESKYGFHNSFDGFYHRYPTDEARWAFLANMICAIIDAPTGKPYKDIQELLKGKNYHILTTNQDTQFTRVFPEEKISAIQGDWRYFQCSHRCHDKLYDAVEPVHRMKEAMGKDLKIPSEMLPRCPKCGALMEPWVRSWVFLEGKKYQEEHEKFNRFLEENLNGKLLFLELGVGRMTPMFIQQPFWSLTYQLPNAFYITINPRDARMPEELKDKGLVIREDIGEVFADAVKLSAGKATVNA